MIVERDSRNRTLSQWRGVLVTVCRVDLCWCGRYGIDRRNVSLVFREVGTRLTERERLCPALVVRRILASRKSVITLVPRTVCGAWRYTIGPSAEVLIYLNVDKWLAAFGSITQLPTPPC